MAGSSGGISIGLPKKFSMFIYIVTLVLAVAARTAQLLTNINYNTGRYLNENPLLNYPVFIVIIGMVLCGLVLAFGKAQDKVIDECILINSWRLRYDRLKKKMPMGIAYCSLIMCLLLIAEVILNFGLKISNNMNERGKIFDENMRDAYSIFTGITAWDFIEAALIFFVFLIFLTMAMNIIKKDGISRANCAAMSIFAAWKIASVFMMFNEYNVIANSTLRSYDLMTSILSTFFFLKVARLFEGMEKKNTRFWVAMLGYLTSIVAAMTTLPRYILLLIPTGYDDRLNMAMPNISDIGLFLVPAAIVTVFWTSYTYREMSKGVSEIKRWTLAARPKELDMDDLDINGVDTDSI